MSKKSGEEKLQRKIFQPSEETEIKINIICELTGMSLSELINSLFDTIGNAEDVVNAYNEAKEAYHRKLKCIMSNVLSADVLPEDFFWQLGIEEVAPEDVNLTPSLLGLNNKTIMELLKEEQEKQLS